MKPTSRFLVVDREGRTIYAPAWVANEPVRPIPRIGESVQIGETVYRVVDVLHAVDRPFVQLTVEPK